MIFDLQSIHKIIKETPGITFTDSEFLEFSYDPLRKDLIYTSKYGNLSFDKTRVSKILNGKEFMYTTLANSADNEKSEQLMLDAADEIFKRLFDDINFDAFIKKLIDLMNSDELFNTELKEKINNGFYNNNQIYAEFMLYCLKLENARIKTLKQEKNSSGRIKIKRANPSIIGNIISNIIANKNVLNNESVHTKAWTLQDKMNKNKIERYLQMKMEKAFEEYDAVMEIIEAVCSQDMYASKYLYSYYEDIYFTVLGEVLGEGINDDNIANKSTTIFNRINEYVYKDIVESGKVKGDFEVIRYHLFAVTVTVFYQCHFLLKMEN